MTAYAEHIYRNLMAERDDARVSATYWRNKYEAALREALAQTQQELVAIREAVMAEREACAKVADRYVGADPIAAAIRNRSNT
jgi:ElaB/YqjD/DUF883 family membrane-anchored ribosome-binding protein